MTISEGKLNVELGKENFNLPEVIMSWLTPLEFLRVASQFSVLENDKNACYSTIDLKLSKDKACLINLICWQNTFFVKDKFYVKLRAKYTQ